MYEGAHEIEALKQFVEGGYEKASKQGAIPLADLPLFDKLQNFFDSILYDDEEKEIINHRNASLLFGIPSFILLIVFMFACGGGNDKVMEQMNRETIEEDKRKAGGVAKEKKK